MKNMLVFAVMALALSASDACATYNQRVYRWRNDDGTLDAATWKADQNTPVSVAKNQPIRLRFEINNNTGLGSTTCAYQIQYAASDAGPWTTIPTSGTTEAFVMRDTANYSNNDRTTTSYMTGGTELFEAGYALDASNESPNFFVSWRTELEYCFQATDTALAGQTYYFRLWHGPASGMWTSQDLNSYEVYPSLTIAVFQAGQWQDANKDGPDDDDLCWAAAASNLLYWGGWDAGLTSAQAVFDVFEDHWTNDISRMYEAWRWWLDGTVPGSRAPGSKVDVGGAGGYYQGEYSSAFFVSSMLGTADLLLDTLSTAFTNAFGVTLGLLKTASTDTHALTVWGYDLDSAGQLLGLRVADSDDGLNQLQYVGVQYDAANSYWTLSSDPTWYIRELNALGARGGATNAVFGGSGTITGQRYGAGGVKSLDYSANGQTPVPEPGSLILVSLGVLVLFGVVRSLRRP